MSLKIYDSGCTCFDRYCILLMNRPSETWAFADACKKLFALTHVTPERLKEVGADIKWFEHS